MHSFFLIVVNTVTDYDNAGHNGACMPDQLMRVCMWDGGDAQNIKVSHDAGSFSVIFQACNLSPFLSGLLSPNREREGSLAAVVISS